MQAVRSRFTGSDKTTGVLLVIGSCISLQIGAAFAVQLFPQLGAWGVTTLRLGVAALVIATLITLPFGGAGAAQAFADPGVLALAVGTGLLASVVPYTFELAALRRLPNNVFSILLSLEPGIAAIGGWLLLSQDTGALRWTAILLLTVASMGITITSRPQRAAGEPAPVTSTIAQVDAP